MPIITLEPTTIAFANLLAVMRNGVARNNKVTDKQMGKQNPIEIDEDGLLGEFAVAKYLNVFPDFSISPRSGGADLIRNNKKIDVKATRYKSGNLVIHIDKKADEVDLYILAIIQENKSVDIVGWIESTEAIQEINIGDLGHGKGYVIPQSKLKKFGKPDNVAMRQPTDGNGAVQ